MRLVKSGDVRRGVLRAEDGGRAFAPRRPMGISSRRTTVGQTLGELRGTLTSIARPQVTAVAGVAETSYSLQWMTTMSACGQLHLTAILSPAVATWRTLMQPFQILTSRERRAVLVVACVASLAVLSVTLLPFVDDGNTPWFDSSSELATAAQRCSVATHSSRRHECLREVAQAAARSASSPAALARR